MVWTARARTQEEPREEDRRHDEQPSGDDAHPRQCLVQTARPVLRVLELFGRNTGIICRRGNLGRACHELNLLCGVADGRHATPPWVGWGRLRDEMSHPDDSRKEPTWPRS